MILALLYLIGCLLGAYVGSRFVIWVLRRNLPVPSGRLLWVRFLVWWMVSVGVSVAIYGLLAAMAVLVVYESFDLGRILESTVLMFGFLILSVPYWIGLLKGVELQLSQRWQK